MDRCVACNKDFSRSRPRCGGRECQRYRRGLNLQGGRIEAVGLCVLCCIDVYPSVKRRIYFLDSLSFFCLGCFVEHPVAQVCKCCPETPYGYICCKGLAHKCCRNPKIIFIEHPLLFAYPRREDRVISTGWMDRDTTSLLDKLTSLSKSRLDPGGFTKNHSRRFAATEIEIFSYKDASELNDILNKWHCSVVRDGSMLREANVSVSEDKTFEINTSPACGNTLIEELKEITEGLKSAKATVTTSCSVHVHIDCRNDGYQEIQKLFRVYKYIEEALFAAVHYTRYNNNFCTHCGDIFFNKFINGIKPDTKSAKMGLIEGVYGKGMADQKIAKKVGRPAFHDVRADHYGRNRGLRNPARYSSINPHSYFLRGTIESRIHHGSTDFKEIYGWTKLLIDLFDSIGRIPETKLEKLLEVTPEEVKETKYLLGTPNFLRQVDVERVAVGTIVLRSLLPDEDFQHFLEKVAVACQDPVISCKKVLPCQGKDYTKNPEKFEKQTIVNPNGGRGFIDEAIRQRQYVQQDDDGLLQQQINQMNAQMAQIAQMAQDPRQR